MPFTSPVELAAPTPIRPPAAASELTDWRLPLLAEMTTAPLAVTTPEVSIPATTLASLCAAAEVDCTPNKTPPPDARAVTSSLDRPERAVDSAKIVRLPTLKLLLAPPTVAVESRLVVTTALLTPTAAVVATVIPQTSAVCPTSDRDDTVNPTAVSRTEEAPAVTVPPVVTLAVPPLAARAKNPAAIESTSTVATRSDWAEASTKALPARVASEP